MNERTPRGEDVTDALRDDLQVQSTTYGSDRVRATNERLIADSDQNELKIAELRRQVSTGLSNDARNEGHKMPPKVETFIPQPGLSDEAGKPNQREDLAA